MSETALKTAAASTTPALYEFGPFRLDAVKRLVSRDGRAISLTPKALDVLLVLLENRGRALDKDELMRAVWPDIVVEENNLARNVSALRKALGEKTSEHRYVVTIPGRGYRFVAQVREVLPAEAEAAFDRLIAQPARETLVLEEEGEGARPGAAVVAVRSRWERLPRRSVAVGLAALTTLLITAAAWQIWRSQGKPVGDVSSLAVLPFDNLSTDPDQDYLSDGITDALITELASIRSLRVISRQSVMRYRDSRQSLPQIARELGVDAIVEGTAVRSGSRVRVSAQLLHAPTDRHLWAESYERDVGDVLALQTEIARTVAHEIRATVTGSEQVHLARSYRVDPEAYELYLRGRYFLNRRWTDGAEIALPRGASYLEQATARDPGFALAHATLALTYMALAYYRILPPWEATPQSDGHARRALELDPQLAEARTAMATNLAFLHWDWAGAEPEFRKALELNPGDADARLWYAFFLLHVGRYEEALAESSQGLRTDLFHPLLICSHLLTLVELGRHEEALRLARANVELEPSVRHTLPFLRGGLGWLLLRTGHEEDALAEFEAAEYGEGIARVRALRGDPSALRALLRKLDERAKRRYVSPLDFASLLTALGEKDQAFARLEEAYRTRVPTLARLKFFPDWVPLRSDPRYAELLRRMNLG